MQKKIFIILSIVLVLVLCIWVVSTPGLISQKSCFDYEDWSDMQDEPWMIITGYKDSKYCSKDIVMPSEIKGVPVKEIGRGAFFMKRVQSVVLPEGLEHIKEAAFFGNSIDTLIIPSSVIGVYELAFYGNEITELIIEDGVVHILDQAFYNNKLESIIIPNSVGDLQFGAFMNNPISEIIIDREDNIFADEWEEIGFPIELLP